jgi:hypothetical protein
MHELISQLDIQLYLFKQQGKLKYSIMLPSKPLRNFVLCEADYDGLESQVADGLHLHGAGADVSAVGVELKLLQNDGMIQLGFEGKDGSTGQ